MIPQRFQPKLLTILREGCSWKQVYEDVIAGFVVGTVALPLAVAFAIASGVHPEQGLYTAIVAGFLIAALGGSRAQVSGPTGAFIVVVYKIVEQHGYEGLATATLMAGILMVLMGISGMGVLLRYVPYPLTVGFTSGIALIIFSSQIADLLGLPIAKLPASFVDKWEVIFSHLGEAHLPSLLLGLFALALLVVWQKVTSKVPGPFATLLIGTLVSLLLPFEIATIGSRFGAVPSSLPSPHLPDLSLRSIQDLFQPALTIALLGAIESLLSAVVADGMLGTRHRSDMELVAQGLGNIASPLFQGIPATGAIARTATNIKCGGRTPVSAMVHSLTLLLIMLFFGSYAELIPIPVLAAILVYVAYNMSEWRVFIRILRYPRSDVAVLLVTFFLTVIIDLTVAIGAGVVLSAFLFVRKMESVTRVDSFDEERRALLLLGEIPPGVQLFELFGPLFFSAIERFKTAIRRLEPSPRVLIFDLRHVPVIDGTGIEAIEGVWKETRKRHGLVLLVGLQESPMRAVLRAGVIAPEDLYDSVGAALERARRFIA
jgi:SulP family sulfate permease